LPEPLTNASFQLFEIQGGEGGERTAAAAGTAAEEEAGVETEDYDGHHANRLRLSIVTTKPPPPPPSLPRSPSLRSSSPSSPSSPGTSDLTDSFDVTALLDASTGQPLLVAYDEEGREGGEGGREGGAGRVEKYLGGGMRVGMVNEKLFEVPAWCVEAGGEGEGGREDEAWQVLVHRARYKPFAATLPEGGREGGRERGAAGGSEEAEAGDAAAATTTTTTPSPPPSPPPPPLPPSSGNSNSDNIPTTTTTSSSLPPSLPSPSSSDPVKANLAMIKAHNALQPSLPYHLSPNRFLHVRPQPFYQRYTLHPSPAAMQAERARYTTYTPSSLPSSPSSIDRRAEGKVTGVRDQGVCLSSYAHAAAAAVETNMAVAGGRMERLSVQRLVDCVGAAEGGREVGREEGLVSCKGCYGGWGLTALRYVVEEEGGVLPLEEHEPYWEVEGMCVARKGKEGEREREGGVEEVVSGGSIRNGSSVVAIKKKASPSFAAAAPSPPSAAAAAAAAAAAVDPAAATTTTTITPPAATAPPPPPAPASSTTATPPTPPSLPPSLSLNDVQLIPQGNETLLALAVAEHGSVLISIEVRDDFWFYGGGIYVRVPC